MIAYTTIGTNDLQRAGEFYDKLFEALGAKRGMEFERFIAWTTAPNTPMFGVIKPFDGNAATPGNGAMVALFVGDEEKIKAMHAKALELGGKDEGAPGARGPGFYAAYFRDLDGNKIAAVKIG